MRPGPIPNGGSPLARLARSEAFPGLLLVGAAAAAIAVANSGAGESWARLWETVLSIRLGGIELGKPVHHWINDGLMVLFFFFVGLEIKHEVLDGELRTVRQAVLPVAAAIGGMALPAALYALWILYRKAPEASAGWGIPMATDIAFALGVLALLGNRVPVGLKVFLATLAIVDDLGAVLVIALFYTQSIAWHYLFAGLLILAVSFAANRLGVRKTWPYAALGLLIWLLFLQSGVHATIAGTLLAFTVPARRRLHEVQFAENARELLSEFERVGDSSTDETTAQQLDIIGELQRHAEDVQAPLQRMVRSLSPFVSHCILPLFALANAGVDFLTGAGATVRHAAAQGVVLGLLLGKPLGVLSFSWLAVRFLRVPMPAGVTMRHVHGAAWLAGIGFTMSLFVDGLAFAGRAEAFHASKVAILFASVLAGGLGTAVLLTTRPQEPPSG
ncbi:MAG: Na+/H+ antiporter NhaA [Planctomycetota bacterium]